MNQFNSLPPEIIEFIFNKLNLDDLINLRCVDRRFKEISEQIKIKQLHVSDKSIDWYPKIWLYTNDLVSLNTIEISKFVNNKSIFQLNKNLKRLIIDLEHDDHLSMLNEFELLEQLNLKIKFLSIDNQLNLANLKIFEINKKTSSKFKLILNTSKLFAFKSSYMELDEFDFKYPNRILFYETNNYNDKIRIFNRLEYLKLTKIHDQIDRDILLKFENLNILDLNISKRIIKLKYDNLKEICNVLINQKENLKRIDLQIYFNGIKLIYVDQLNQLKWSSNYSKFNDNILEFQIQNYDLLKENGSYELKLNYCDLIRFVNITPSTFKNKFTFICYISANDHINNEDEFIKFLINLPHLSVLELINCQLTRSFYHQLTNSVYLYDLLCLKIEEKIDLKIDYDFILNLKQLKSFKTNQIICNFIGLIYKFFLINASSDNIGYIFEFKLDQKNYIQLYKTNYLEFNIESYYLDHNLEKIDNFSIKNLNLDELIFKLKKKLFKL